MCLSLTPAGHDTAHVDGLELHLNIQKKIIKFDKVLLLLLIFEVKWFQSM